LSFAEQALIAGIAVLSLCKEQVLWSPVRCRWEMAASTSDPCIGFVMLLVQEFINLCLQSMWWDFDVYVPTYLGCT